MGIAHPLPQFRRRCTSHVLDWFAFAKPKEGKYGSSHTITPTTRRRPSEVDPKHYQVEFENERVRVVRIKYAIRQQRRPLPEKLSEPYILPTVKTKKYSPI
jgi:hypothetical protein